MNKWNLVRRLQQSHINLLAPYLQISHSLPATEIILEFYSFNLKQILIKNKKYKLQLDKEELMKKEFSH